MGLAAQTTTSVLALLCCTHRRFDIEHESCVLTSPEEQDQPARLRVAVRSTVTLDGVVYIQPVPLTVSNESWIVMEIRSTDALQQNPRFYVFISIPLPVEFKAGLLGQNLF